MQNYPAHDNFLFVLGWLSGFFHNPPIHFEPAEGWGARINTSSISGVRCPQQLYGYISSSKRQYSNQVIAQDIWTIRKHHPTSRPRFFGQLHLTHTHTVKNQPLRKYLRLSLLLHLSFSLSLPSFDNNNNCVSDSHTDKKSRWTIMTIVSSCYKTTFLHSGR